MGDFNRGGNRGGFSGGNRGGDRGQGRPVREMFPAVCGTCNKDCQVPFQPSGDKPVLCSACFSGNSDRPQRDTRRNEGYDRGGSRDGGRMSSRSSRTETFRSRTPVQNTESAAFQVDKLKKQIDVLTTKIDAIVNHLGVVMPHNQESSPELKKVLENLKTNDAEISNIDNELKEEGRE